MERRQTKLGTVFKPERIPDEALVIRGGRNQDPNQFLDLLVFSRNLQPAFFHPHAAFFPRHHLGR